MDVLMKQHRFRNDKEYKDTQIRRNKNKLGYTWVDNETINLISSHIKEHIEKIKFGICHGTRRGNEQKWFQENLGVVVIGTEISPTAAEFPCTIQWDFHDVKDEWLDAVDFIYSNSFDHTKNHKHCLDQWMSCIRKPDGICYIEWTEKHDILGYNKLDCFAASKKEYIGFIGEKYEIFEILEKTSEKHGTHYIFAIKHRNEK
jgi:hypothetical protein